MNPNFLVCPPVHFGAARPMNPWSHGLAADPVRAGHQWGAAMRTLEACGGNLRYLKPDPSLPEQCCVGQCGLVWGTVAVPSRFAAPERRGEVKIVQAAFEAVGKSIAPLPEEVFFEGQGDAAIDDEGVLWATYGFRTLIETHWDLADRFACESRSLGLVDPRFFHLDQCFALLTGGYLLWYPPAFDPQSRISVESHFPPDRRHAVSDEDAHELACSALCIERTVLLPGGSERLTRWLAERRFEPIQLEIDEFLRAGVGVRALALALG